MWRSQLKEDELPQSFLGLGVQYLGHFIVEIHNVSKINKTKYQ